RQPRAQLVAEPHQAILHLLVPPVDVVRHPQTTRPLRRVPDRVVEIRQRDLRLDVAPFVQPRRRQQRDLRLVHVVGLRAVLAPQRAVSLPVPLPGGPLPPRAPRVVELLALAGLWAPRRVGLLFAHVRRPRPPQLPPRLRRPPLRQERTPQPVPRPRVPRVPVQ